MLLEQTSIDILHRRSIYLLRMIQGKENSNFAIVCCFVELRKFAADRSRMKLKQLNDRGFLGTDWIVPEFQSNSEQNGFRIAFECNNRLNADDSRAFYPLSLSEILLPNSIQFTISKWNKHECKQIQFWIHFILTSYWLSTLASCHFKWQIWNIIFETWKISFEISWLEF